jgi:hypothetical protein
VWPFTARCPVDDDERDWIEASMDWFADEFGRDVLDEPPLLPSHDLFAEGVGSVNPTRALLTRVCERMRVDPGRIKLIVEDADPHAEVLAHLPMYSASWDGAAGHFRQRDGRTVITVAVDEEPVRIVAVLAHEVAHERLLGEGRIASSRRDNEPLTDLLTVFFGLGIFSANAAFEHTQGHDGWRSRSLGYLSERMYGYALARYAWLRGELRPDWSRDLDVNPRAYVKQGLRYLTAR